MASKINKSFIWGVCIASCTWLVSLYLFWRLGSGAGPGGPFPTRSESSQKLQYTRSSSSTGGNDDKDQSFAFFEKYRSQQKLSRDQLLRAELMQDLEPVDLPRGNGTTID